MIEEAIVNYLNNHDDLTDISGKVYFYQVASEETMPWVVVDQNGGSRYRLTQGGFSEAKDTITIYVDHQNQFAGKILAEKIQATLENYRGDMGDALDLVITSATIRPGVPSAVLAGFRYIVTIYVKYRFATNIP